MKKGKLRMRSIKKKEIVIFLIGLILISAIYIIKPFSKAEQIDTSSKIKTITEALKIDEDQIATTQRVYIGTPIEQGGEGTATSGTRENPVETLQEAYNILSSQGGIIVFLENRTIDSWPTVNATKPVVIMGDTGVEIATLTTNTVQFLGNVSFLDLTLNASYADATSSYFYCNGNLVTFGSEGENNFKITRDSTSIYYPTIFGAGESGTTVSSTNVKIYSGSYSQVFSGGNITANVEGETNLLVDGGNKDNSNISFELKNTTLSRYLINSGNVPFGNSATTASVGSTNTIIKNVNFDSSNSVSGANGNIGADANFTIENSVIERVVGVSNYTTIGGNITVNINNLSSNTGFYNFANDSGSSASFSGNSTLEYNLTATNVTATNFSLESSTLKTYNANINISDSTITNLKGIAGNSNNQDIQISNVTGASSFKVYPGGGTNALTLQNVGTTESPLTVQIDNAENEVSFTMEEANIQLANTTLMNNCTIQNSCITLADDITLTVNGTYAGNAESTICLAPTSKVYLNGTVKGTTGVDINNSDQYASIQAILANCENGENSFTKTSDTQKFPDKTLYVDNTKVTTYVNWNVYYDYQFSNTNTVVYVDGDNGQDDYNDETINSQIGSLEYPVQTLDKAYSLLNDNCNTIVLVGNVYIGDTTANTFIDLPELPSRISNPDEFNVTITTTDGVNDFSTRANLYFLASGTSTRHYQFNSNVTLQNVKLINNTTATETSVPNGDRYLYAGGYKLVIDEGVQTDLQTTVNNTTRGRRCFHLFAGPYGKQVEKAYLEVNSGYWSTINMVGNSNAMIGDSTKTEYSKDDEPVLILKVHGGATSQLNSNGTDANTTIYGNVKVEVGSKEADSTLYPIMHNGGGLCTYALGTASIYGNADFKISNKYGMVDRFYVALLNNTKVYGDVNWANGTDKDFSIYTNFEIGAGELNGGTTTIDINRFSGNGFAVNSTKKTLKTSEDSSIIVNFIDAKNFKGITFSDTNTSMLGKAEIHFYGDCTFATYQSNNYEYLPTSGSANIYFHGQQVAVDSIKNLGIYAKTSEEGVPSYIVVKKDSSYKEIEIDENSEIYMVESATINNDLTIKKNAKITIDGTSLAVTGNVVGEDGILVYNGTEPAQITGEAQGTIFAETTQEEAKIQANTTSLESAISSSDINKIQITSTLTEENRIWSVKSLNITQVIYVKDDGNDINTGIDENNSVATMTQAFKLVPQNGTIVVCGPLTISEWPENDCKDVTISSKITRMSADGQEETIDFRDTNNAVTTFKNSARKGGSGENTGIHLDADITFTYLSIAPESNNYFIFASANKIIFGEEGDEDSIRNANKNYFTIYGGSASGKNSYVDFTVNAGMFHNIIVGARSNNVDNATFTMNGGSINTLNITHYSSITDTVNVNIYGGSVRGNIQPSATSGFQYGIVNINLKNEVEFGSSSVIYVGGQNDKAYYNLNVEGKDDANSIIIPTVYMGSNSSSNSNLTIGKIKNATINTLYAGGNGTGTQTYPVDIVLDGKTIVKTLNCGPAKTGSIPNTANITIKGDAQIEILNREINGRKVEAVNIIYENTGSEQKHRVVTEAYEGIDCVTIGENAYIELNQEDATFKFNALSVLGNGHAYLTKAFILNGNYIGNETKDSAGYLYLKDGTQFTINGTVTGYTILRCMDAEDYVSESGLLVTSALVTDSYAENYFSLEKETISYTATDTNSNWQVKVAGDTIDRNTVYVSHTNGNDGTIGTSKVPLKTIHGAYEKIESLYNLNYSQLDSEQKELIDANGYKIILLDGVVITTGDTTIPEHSEYKVTITSDKDQNGILDEDETGNMLFNENAQNSIYFAGTTILEYLNINSTIENGVRPVFAANGFDVKFGKEINVTAITGNYPEIYGGRYTGDAVASTNLTVESGKYTAIYGGGYSAIVNGNVNLRLGNEEDNSGPDTVSIGQYNQTYTGVFGGGFNSEVNGNIDITVYGGKYYRITGGGKQVSAIANGDINLEFRSGETERIYGGGESAVVNGNVTSIIGSGNTSAEAKITGYLRGSGMYEGLASGKIATVTIKDGALLPTDTQVAAGGYQGNVSKSVLNIEGGIIECNVFGGGWGIQGDTTKGISDETEVNIAGGTIKASIFGGGNLGKVSTYSKVNVAQAVIEGKIYGGGNEANVQDTEITISLDNTNTEVYGGCYAGQVLGKSIVNITGGNLGHVFGGGYGQTAITQTSEVKITNGIVQNIYGGGNLGKTLNTNVIISGGEVQAIYAGGNLAEVEKTNTKLEKGKVENIYGGGYGETATVSESLIETTGGEAVNIYGGGELGKVLKTTVNINGGNLQNVYGGGNKAQVNSSNVNIYKGSIIGNIFGGGNEADVIATQVYLYGGNIGDSETKTYVYGGGNKASATTTTINIGSEENSTEYMLDTNCNIFGGNNSSGIQIQDSIEEVNINVNKDITTDIYGGCNSTGLILNKVTINVNAKVTGNVYGAGFGENTYVGTNEANVENMLIKINTSGNITDNVYGGGNAGQVYGNTNIEVYGTANNIYGAGYGEKAIVYGDSNITQYNGSVNNIYGGGFEAKITETNISIQNGTVESIYGGGYIGTIGTSNINITGGSIASYVYGGGYNGEVLIDTNVNIFNGQVGTSESDVEVYGGGFGPLAIVQGNTNVTIKAESDSLSELYVYGNVYGGGNSGDVYGNSYVTIFDATITKSVYGGGNEANIGQSEEKVDENHGNVYVEFTQGVIGEIILDKSKKTYTGELFGGGNLGRVYGDTQVLAGDKDSEYYVTLNGEMYAGGKGTTGFTTVYGNSNAIIAGINTTVQKYGSIERGEVAGEVNITFNNYKNRNAVNRYKNMSGINKATNLNLINSYVYLTEGLTQIYNVDIPYGSGLMISKDSVILGNFSGGGTLYLQNEVLLTINQDLIGDDVTTLILNPELLESKIYIIEGSVDFPYIKILGNDNMNGTAFRSGYASKYAIQNATNSDNNSIYYINDTIIIPRYLAQNVAIDAGKMYTSTVSNTEDVYILEYESFTAETELEFTMVQDVSVDVDGNRVEEPWDGTFLNVHRIVMLKSEENIQIIPRGTTIVAIIDGVKYWYKVESENETTIEVSKFKLWEENVSYEDETTYFQEVTNVYEERSNAGEDTDNLTNIYAYVERFKFIFDFSNCTEKTLQQGIYNVVVSAYDNINEDSNLYEDEEEIYTITNTNAVQIETRNYNLTMKDGEDSYYVKDGFDQNSKIELNAILTMDRVSIYSKSDLGKKLNAILTIQDESGQTINIPSGTSIYVNGTRYQPSKNNCVITLVEELQSKMTEYELKIEIDLSMAKLSANSIAVGEYSINLDYYLADENNHLISQKLYNSILDGLNIGELSKYGIDVEVKNTNNLEIDKLLLINEEGDIVKTVSLKYLLQLMYENDIDNGGKIVITSQKKVTPKTFDYENIESLVIDDTIEVENTDGKIKTQDIDLIFSNTLENGTYRIVFTLCDKFDNKLTDITLNFIVAR